jgi:hypothetical protein
MTTTEDILHATPERVSSGLQQMPGHARLWIYKTTRALSKAETDLVFNKGSQFIRSWEAHGKQMFGAVDVLQGRFVILAADETITSASGCSIDSSVAFVKELERDLNMTLTDRMLVIYAKDSEIHSCRLDRLKPLLDAGEITLDTLVFDDLVGTKEELDARFQVRLGDSWMIRFVN